MLFRSEKTMATYDLPDTIYDGDDPHSVGRKDDDHVEAPKLFGWRSIIWKRALSDNCWRKGCNVQFYDILANNPSPSDLLPSYPNLSIHGDDVVHVKAWVRLDVPKTHMVSIDMRSNTLKSLVPCAAAKLDAYCPHFPSVLSNHLSNTRGNY